MENNTFPSFIDFKTKYILEIYTKENIIKTIYTIYDLNNFHYQLIKNIKNVCLSYLPKINNQTNEIYYDGLYIEENIINKNTLKKEIEVLFCLIDDNEYYKYIKPIGNNIIINNIYFIIVEGNKNINIYNAIINYLNKINLYTIKEIYLGRGFFQEKLITCVDNLKYFYYKIPIINLIDEDVLIHKKKCKLSNNTIIKANTDIFKGNKLKLILGLSFLFDSINIIIDGAKVIDSRFPNKIEDVSKVSQKKFIVLKIYDFSFLENKILKNYFENINSISSIMLYISENVKNYQSSSNNKNLDILLKNRDFIIYSEVPIKYLEEYTKNTIKIKKINNNGSLLLKKNKSYNLDFHFYSSNFNEYLFIFKKFESIKYIETDISGQLIFSFLINHNDIICDFYEQYGIKDLLFFEKIIKFINVLKYLDTKINNIYFLNYYYGGKINTKIKNILETKNLIIVKNSTSSSEDILKDILKEKKSKKKKNNKKK